MARITSANVKSTSIESGYEGDRYAEVEIAVKVGRRTHRGTMFFRGDAINGGACLCENAPFSDSLESLIRANSSRRACAGRYQNERKLRVDFINLLLSYSDATTHAERALEAAADD